MSIYVWRFIILCCLLIYLNFSLTRSKRGREGGRHNGRRKEERKRENISDSLVVLYSLCSVISSMYFLKGNQDTKE